MRRFLCLWFPRFSTDRWRRLRTEPLPRPLALSLRGQGGVRLTAVDERAAALGLHAGMALADARALVPDLVVADAAPEADTKALAALADWCGYYSPWCATDGMDGMRLDITGCAHLFDGEAGMAADAAWRLERLGFAVRVAVADTPAAAWGWARQRPWDANAILPPGEAEALLSLPVAALRLDADSLDTLRTLGLDTVGAVARLPRAPLSQRLGAAMLDRLDRMFGRLAEPISPRAVAEPFLSRMIFAEPIGRREDIDEATGRLTRALCRDLSRKGQGARRLTLAFYRVDGTVQRLAIGTNRPTYAAPHLLRLFAERLETVAPGFGIEAMTLEATQTEPIEATQGAFASGGMDEADLAGLVDRLRNRLGDQRVVQLVPVESHVPERAQKCASPLEGEVGDAQCRRVGGDGAAFSVRSKRRRHHPPPGPSGRPRIESGAGSPPQGGRRYEPKRMSWILPAKAARPLKLLPIPEPVTAMAPIPDDPPLSFRWGHATHRVIAADGPERIGPEWWIIGAPRKPRDYYRVEDSEGRRFWLYREGLYDGKEPPRWFLHGFFA